MKKKPVKNIETIRLPYCESCKIINLKWSQDVRRSGNIYDDNGNSEYATCYGTAYIEYNIGGHDNEVDFDSRDDEIEDYNNTEVLEEYCSLCGGSHTSRVAVPIKTIDKRISNLSPKDRNKLYEDGIPIERDSFNTTKAIKTLYLKRNK